MAKPQYKKLPFIKADDLPASGSVEMKVLGNCRAFDGNFGLKLNLDVEVKGKKYCFSIKPTNPGLRVIVDGLVNRKKISIERGEYNGNEFVQVCGIPQKQ